MDHSLSSPASPLPNLGLRHVVAWLLAATALGLAGYAVEGVRRSEPSPQPAASPVVEPAAAEAPPPLPTLGARMRKVLDYTARRYRLSPLALEPVFAAVEHVGGELGIDPLLIVAVIGVESSFNPFAESVMGAQGLMQVIPRYHADKLPPARAGGRPTELALFDPVINVRVGAQALHEYIGDSGDVVDGLQQFAGAWDDPQQAYADKVLSEFERLEAVSRGGRLPPR